MSYADYGHNVKALRQGLTQVELAKLAGCTHTTICLQEPMATGAGLRLAARTAEALGVTVDTLIGPLIQEHDA